MYWLNKLKSYLKNYKYIKLVSKIEKGKTSEIVFPTHVSNTSNIVIGEYFYIGIESWFSTHGKITIKDGVIIGPRLRVYTGNHNYNSDKLIPYDEITICKDVILEENVWIGGDVIILPGVTIGEGSIVDAGSVVTKSFPKCSIIGGNLAKIIGNRDEEKYFILKKENKIYLKYKKEGKIKPIFLNSNDERHF